MVMAAPASSKRQKSSDSGGQPPNGNYSQEGPYGQQQPYNGAPGGQQQFPTHSGYNNMWQHGQQQGTYGNQGPWPSGQQGMYRQSPPLGPPNGGPNNWNGGYRGQSPAQSSGGRRGGKHSSSNNPKKSSPNNGSGPYQPGWQQQQFPMQSQWGGGGPSPQMWNQGPSRHPPQPSPLIQGQPMVPLNQNAWPGGHHPSSPHRQSKKGRPRSSPDPLMGPGFPQAGMMAGLPADVLCAPIGFDASAGPDLFMTSTGVGTGLDDEDPRKCTGGSSVTSREKGRGSYRCGRCGVPKKGHVCPYQPKLKRRPDEPPPETRNAAIQVEMDEFMTLRRLNLEIQGYPESYATASHIMENRMIGEPHPYAIGDSGVMSHMGYMGNEPMMGQVSVPLHVASQPTPMTAESDDVPQEKPPSPTMDPLGDEPPVDEVPVEAEKATAV